MASPLDLVLLGPAPPYRGGIADTQVHFAKALQKQKKMSSYGPLQLFILRCYFQEKLNSAQK